MDDQSLNPDGDLREGPSIELPQDADHFLNGNVWAAYEDGKPLDLGDHESPDPAGEIFD